MINQEKSFVKDCCIENVQQSSQPVLRETMTIMLDGKPVTIYKDDLEKQIYAGLYERFTLDYGA